MTLQFSPGASDDLLDIAKYIGRQNSGRALSFVDELTRKCEFLASNLRLATRRPEFGEGIYSMPHGRYIIFIRETNVEVRDERIVHGARNIQGKDL